MFKQSRNIIVLFLISLSAATTYADQYLWDNTILSDYTVLLQNYGDRQILTIDGNVDGFYGSLSAYSKALSLIPDGKDIIVQLNSGGGALDNFASMIKLLRRQNPRSKFIAYVPDGAECTSACINFFLEADVRLSAPNARFGFHSASHSDTGQLLKGVAERRLKKSGINEEFLEFLKQKGVFSTRKVTYFTGQELLKHGIVDGVELAEPVVLNYSSYKVRNKRVTEKVALTCNKIIKKIFEFGRDG